MYVCLSNCEGALGLELKLGLGLVYINITLGLFASLGSIRVTGLYAVSQIMTSLSVDAYMKWGGRFDIIFHVQIEQWQALLIKLANSPKNVEEGVIYIRML